MRKIPTKATLDGDILVYHTAFWAEANNPDLFPNKLKSLIKNWTPEGVDSINIALSCSRSDNFRRNEWPKYKSNREDLYIPEYLDDVREYIRENYKTKELPSLEADDILGIYTSSNQSIAVTIDKDLKGVQGWHFNPAKDKELRYVPKDDAYRFFCTQWMTGDSTDGIPGLWRIGPKKAEQFLSEWNKDDWEKNIIELYDTDKHRIKDSCGIDHPEIAIVMARCVKILSNADYKLRKKEIKLWTPEESGYKDKE